MHDDPFARAVERVQVAEQAEQASKRKRRQEHISSGSRTGFRIHVAVYLTVNILLIAIWATTWQFNDATSYPWFIFVLLGWGIGLAAHYAAVRNHLSQPVEQFQSDPSQPGSTIAPAAQLTTQELTDLAELHRSGALSDEEFIAAKAKLLQ